MSDKKKNKDKETQNNSNPFAQNEELTGPSLSMLDRFDEMLTGINEKGM